MNRLLLFLSSVFVVLFASAQAPNQINYQGVARKANGNPIVSQPISLRLTIHNITAGGAVLYTETRAVTTNDFGLFNVAIGGAGASSVSGSIASINWASGNKFLQVEMDPLGGSSFLDMGTSQLLSVPYALYANTATPVGPAGGDLTGNYPNPTVAKIRGVNVTTVAPTTNYMLGYNGSSWTPTNLATHPDNYWRLSGSNIYNANSGNVGIGITTPTQKLDVNGNLKTLGFIMPTGAGAGKALISDAVGNASWSSTITATKLVLPYKDSASSNVAHIFHIIQTSLTSTTGALYGVTRSTAAAAVAVGGQVSSTSPGAGSSALRGENLGTSGFGIGVYGSQNGSGWGVYGTTPSGIGVYGNSTNYLGVYGTSNSNSGVFGFTNSTGGYLAGVFGYATNFNGNGVFGYATRNLGYGTLGIADSSIGVYGQTNALTYGASSNDGVAVYGIATNGGNAFYGRSNLGEVAKLEITNPSNNSTALDIESVGIGRAIVARSSYPGFVNAGVVDVWTTTLGGNAIFGRGTRAGGWGVYGLSDSSAGVAGVGYRPGSVGVYGQGWMGSAAQLFIDNTFVNTSNTVEISNSQTGKALNILQTGNGLALYARSANNGVAKFENINAANSSTIFDIESNGTGRAIVARADYPGFVNAGVVDVWTTTLGGNAIFGRGTRAGGWGVYGLSDSAAGIAGVGYRAGSVGVYGQGWMGSAAQFFIDNTFVNTSNTVEISNSQTGKAVNILQTGNGLAMYASSANNGVAKFENTNAANSSTIFDIESNGTGRAIVARADYPGFVNAGVVDVWTTTLGGNAIFGRGTRAGGWGVYGLSDSAAGVAGVGYRAGSVGVYGQGWMGSAAQLFIDNTFVNASNTVEISNSQTGKALNILQTGNGLAMYANSVHNGVAKFENTNAANSTTILDIESNGTGRAIVARADYPGFVNAGVVDVWTTTLGGNAIFGRGTRAGGWGVYGFSDSSAGVAGIAYREDAVGVYGQGYYGRAGQFAIDNTFPNSSNTVDISNSQSGRALNILQSGTGVGLYSRSTNNSAAVFENINSVNAGSLVNITTNGTGRMVNAINNNTSTNSIGVYSQTDGFGYAVYGVSQKSHGILGVSINAGSGSAGVYGYNISPGGNGVIGWGTRVDDWGVAAHSDSSVAVWGESGLGTAGYFYNYGFNNSAPAVYGKTNGLSNAASFYIANTANVADAVTIDRLGEGRSLLVDGASFNNLMNFYNPVFTGKSTTRLEGPSGIALLGHAGGSFAHSGGGRVGVGVYGAADSVGSTYNYGVVGLGRGGSLENGGVVGYVDASASGSSINAGIMGVDFGGSGPHFAGYFQGNVQVTGTLSKGAGTFKIDHPQDPLNKYLLHSFVESPDMMNVYNGNIVTDKDGKAVVDLPGYFEAENIDFKYQLTVIGQFSQAIIGEEIKDNKFVILTDKPNVKVSWQVTGVRNDKFAQENRVVPEVEKQGTEKGKYLYPELYGQPKENGIGFMKAGLPRYQESTNAEKNPNSNKANEKMMKMVEQKRTALSNQVPRIEQQPMVTKQSNETGIPVPEKAKSLTTKIEVPQQKTEKAESKQAEMVNPNTEKARELSASATETVLEKNVSKPTETQNANLDKAKKISVSTLEPKPEIVSMDQKLSQDSTSAMQQKTKQLKKDLAIPDQLKQNDNGQKNGAADKKGLSKPNIQLPEEQGKKN